MKNLWSKKFHFLANTKVTLVFVVVWTGPKSQINSHLNDTCLIDYLTIIPWARMGPESIAYEAEGRMGYWLRGHEGERNNCFSKIQLVGQKYGELKFFS